MQKLKGRTTHKGVGKRSHAELSLCEDISTPLLEGFVQFYLEPWLHTRRAYLLFIEGHRSHEVALNQYTLSKGGQAELICFEAVEFLLMILSDVVTVESEPFPKMGRTHCLYIWIMVDGPGPHFRLTSNLT